jgi:hypothetical protein
MGNLQPVIIAAGGERSNNAGSKAGGGLMARIPAYFSRQW